ncbi:MAG: hydrolase [bacterium]|nr:hydrolase [bacterium]
MNAKELRETTEKIWRDNVHRAGLECFLDWLARSDYYTAPCSTQYHLACEGGLAHHSLNVYDALMELMPDTSIPEESATIAAMGHDLCKVNFYKPSFRNKKNETTGAWEKVPWYDIEDSYPFGHGEKSVILLRQYIDLEPEEMLAIRWHMGGFTPGMDYSMQQAFSKAAGMTPLVPLLHAADLIASHITEA